ncbi:hypothetical protein [Formosa maritima]|uniref:Uncharacterized protein n=1 Tax=Formosa maritima TaxID=2592046 RepID=A0A5D0GFC1_9FLAO|nr:hypothetical protein [Formosa maritima]TYA56312.1 hypothetical protein FVF61_06110 [Formosa maritima]
MKTLTHYTHETDEQVLHKKRIVEINIWISHLNYIINECDWLAKIASNKIQDKDLRDSLLEKSENNSSLLNEFYSYRSTLNSFYECNDLDCDLYYIDLHSTYCKKYLKHLENYRAVKDQVFLKILL